MTDLSYNDPEYNGRGRQFWI